jgi:transposase
MSKQRKRYDGTFKGEAVRLAEESGKRDRQIEQELGVYQGAIRHWREELSSDPEHAFPGTGHLKPLEEENRQLRRELEIARQERDILKKAMAIFSRRPKASTDS